MKNMKDMTIHWRNFFIIFIIIFLLGIIIWLIITPHSQISNKEYEVIGRIVGEVEPPVKSTSTIEKAYVGIIPLEGVVSEVQSPIMILIQSPIRVVDDINCPKLIKRVDPIYPEKSRKAEVEGEVILEVHTDIYGRVKRAHVLRSINPLLDKAAIDAIFQWKYEPKIINDRPREVIFTVPIKFKLK